MFAYCGNCPIGFEDRDGRSAERAIRANRLDEGTGTIQAVWERQGVFYIPSSSGNGGQIVNSYKITSDPDMTLYARYLKKTTDDFSGSVEAMVFEWWIHNVIFYMVEENSSWYYKAKDVDLGRTIYNDRHGLMGIEGFASKAMWMLFSLMYPEQAASDQEIYWALEG